MKSQGQSKTKEKKETDFSEDFAFLIQKITSIKNNNKNIALWILITLFGLIFGHNISNFLANYSFLDKEQVSGLLFNSIYIFFIIIILFKFSWYFIINYKMSKTYLYWIISISVIYFFKIRNDDSSLLILIPFYKSFLYLDIILIIGGLTTFLLIRNQFGHFSFFNKLSTRIKQLSLINNKKINHSYLEDLPLDGSEINELDLFAEKLVDNIIDFKPDQAFIIAVKAKWGYGKTTFLKRLEYKINNNDDYKINPIIIWFNTWQNQDDKSIVNNFFSLLKKELSVYDGNIENAINKYIGKILSVLYAKEVRILKTFTDDLVGEKGSIEEYYIKIENILTKLNRQIIIMVDDLDRLNKSEIIETIRVLRNVANFKNVIFICGIDKEYLIKNAQLENNYLDKIFNLEIDLPILSESNLFILLKQLIDESNMLKSLTTKILTIDSQKMTVKSRINDEFDRIFYVDDALMDLADLGISDFNENDGGEELREVFLLPSLFFNSRRDIKRFYNYITTNLCILKNIDDIELYDYELFHLLLFRYDWMRKYFEDGGINRWMKGEITLSFSKKAFQEICTLEGISLLDKSIIYTILVKLFPESNAIEGSKNINQRRYFPIYLNNNIFNEAFSYIELIEHHAKNAIEELIVRLDTEPQKNFLLNDIKRFILKEESLSNVEFYKNTLNLLNKNYFTTISDEELLSFIDYGETKFPDEIETILNSDLFVSNSIFEDLLFKLNFHYATIPNDDEHSFGGSDPFEVFFRQKISKKEFTYVNSEYVKTQLLKLLKYEIEKNSSFNQVNKIFSWLIECNFKYFKFYYYSSSVTELMQEYFTNNFQEIFLEGQPREIFQRISSATFVKIFVGQDEKDSVYKNAQEIIERNSFRESDLNLNNFYKSGFENFIDFLNDFPEKDPKKDELITFIQENLNVINLQILRN